jgi:hypothetical protein
MLIAHILDIIFSILFIKNIIKDIHDYRYFNNKIKFGMNVTSGEFGLFGLKIFTIHSTNSQVILNWITFYTILKEIIKLSILLILVFIFSKYYPEIINIIKKILCI